MPVELEQASFFRRRRFQAPHKRKRLLVRLARPFLVALLVVGAPSGLAFWMLTSAAFQLESFEVTGTSRVPERWVRESLAPLVGRHLLWLRLGEVEQRLAVHPWVEGVTVRKELPDRLLVELLERRPAALVRRDGELFYSDRAGVVFAPFDPALGSWDLPLLVGVEEPESEVPRALELVERWAASEPEWAADLSEIEILDGGDYRVHSARAPFPILMSRATVDRALTRLARVVPEIERRYPRIAELDLRFSRQIVIKPVTAQAARNEEG